LLIRVLPKIGKLPTKLRIEPIVDVLDAVALAAYTVVGVIVAIETRCEPLLLWGPLLSALTGAGGSVLRDVVRGDSEHPTLRHALYAEIALVWGFVLAAFLNVYAKAESYDPLQLQAAIVVTMLGGLVTRLVVMRKQIRAPRFR
jgi:polar amino acid transport system substrate-binding protein